MYSAAQDGGHGSVRWSSRGRPAGRAPIGSPIVTAPSDEVLTAGASGAGLATVTADGVVLDVWYPAPRLAAEAGTAGRRTDPVDLRAAERTDEIRGVRLQVLNTTIATLADPPADTADVYLRLHLLSARLVRPRTINLDGIFRTAAEQRLDAVRSGAAR